MRQIATNMKKRWLGALSLGAALLFALTLNAHASRLGGPNGDRDGDGLTNAQEKALRTNPRKADTDRDGLSDGIEVQITHTNPKKKDSDHDGLTDGQEIARHTDPLDDDTDNDGVEDGDDPDPGEHGAEFKIKGQVTAADSTLSCLLTIDTGTGSVQVDASSAQIEGAATCADLNGQLVEIEGEIVSGALQAQEVKVEDEEEEDNAKVEIKGRVTIVNSSGGCFLTVATAAGAMQVDASSATLKGVATCADLARLLVEVEGNVVNNVLLAKKVKVEDD